MTSNELGVATSDAAGARRRVIVVVLAIAAVVVLAAASASLAKPRHPACFGAASRDTVHPCTNPGLRLAVIPSPSDAPIMPSSPCTPIQTTINLCWFGTPAARAGHSAVLLGDSHAQHWRAGLEVAMDALHWQGLSSTRDGCPFTAATTVQSRIRSRSCAAWVHGLIAWFEANPTVSTVFESNHPGTVARVHGQTLLQAQIAGYITAWRELPATVKHIIVIRDIPYANVDTLTCVSQAVSRRQEPGVACELPRSVALQNDPTTLAAEQLHSSRVQVIDLSRYFCDSTWCFPVVGGSLVYRDSNHLTTVFAGTLGPYILASLQRLMRSWR